MRLWLSRRQPWLVALTLLSVFPWISTAQNPNQSSLSSFSEDRLSAVEEELDAIEEELEQLQAEARFKQLQAEARLKPFKAGDRADREAPGRRTPSGTGDRAAPGRGWNV